MSQLTLTFDIELAKPKPKSRSEEADALGITLLELARREIQASYEHWEKLGFSRKEYYDMRCSVLECPEVYAGMDCYKPLFAAWEKGGAEGLRQYHAERRGQQYQYKPPKPYAPWSLERKWAERARRLMTRTRKQFSLIDFYCEALQAKVLENPQYFGVCPLPGEFQCNVFPAIAIEQQAAISKEVALREQEHSTITTQPGDKP